MKLIKLFIKLCFLAAMAFAPSTWGDELNIKNPWALPLPAVSNNGAVYMSVDNHGKADRLTGASSPIASEVEIHKVIEVGGEMKMEKQAAVEIPEHQSVHFQPGGLHIMLMGLRQPLAKGGRFPLTLRFQAKGEVDVTVTVIENGGSVETDHAKHDE